MVYLRGSVFEHADSRGFEQSFEFLAFVPPIMIAEHDEDAVTRTQSGDALRYRRGRDIRAADNIVYQKVARDDDRIRLLRVRETHDFI